MPAPFGATVPAVRNLVLSAARSEGYQVGGPRAPSVSDDLIGEWLEEGGSLVGLRLRGYDRLDVVTRDAVETAARGLVQVYAGSYLADVTHPERTPGGGRLGEVLWTRYERGLTTLVDTVAGDLEQIGGNPDAGLGVAVDVGAAGRFPPPSGWMTRGF